jgi:hypothetical protein
MKLFGIRDTHTNQLLKQFFPDKRSAKRERDKLNQESGHDTRYVVTPGPDHRRYAG